jgi:hypothetical protein
MSDETYYAGKEYGRLARAELEKLAGDLMHYVFADPRAGEKYGKWADPGLSVDAEGHVVGQLVVTRPAHEPVVLRLSLRRGQRATYWTATLDDFAAIELRETEDRETLFGLASERIQPQA